MDLYYWCHPRHHVAYSEFHEPANTATTVPINQKITAAFSKSMDSTTITATTFTLKQGATPVAGSVSYAGTIATFTPANNLQPVRSILPQLQPGLPT